MTCQTGTIREIYERLVAEGHNVCKNTLRTWVKRGIVPAAYVGKKAYIVYDNVLNVLENGTPPPSDGPDNRGIRRIGK